MIPTRPVSLAVVLAAIVFGAARPAAADALVLYAAGSLREAMTGIASAYTASRGVSVRTEFGPSGLLRERIEKGEAVDLFASADLGHPLRLAKDGRASAVVMFARNSVCALSRQGLGLATEGLLARLLAPGLKIGTSTPKADPLGDYTLTLFHRAEAVRAGAEAALLARSTAIVGGPTNSAPINGVDAVVARLQDGTVDVVLAYCSNRDRLVRQMPDLAITELPPELRVGPEYGLALMKGAGAAASDLALFIVSPEGQAILARNGFLPVALPEP